MSQNRHSRQAWQLPYKNLAALFERVPSDGGGDCFYDSVSNAFRDHAPHNNSTSYRVIAVDALPSESIYNYLKTIKASLEPELKYSSTTPTVSSIHEGTWDSNLLRSIPDDDTWTGSDFQLHAVSYARNYMRRPCSGSNGHWADDFVINGLGKKMRIRIWIYNRETETVFNFGEMTSGLVLAFIRNHMHFEFLRPKFVRWPVFSLDEFEQARTVSAFQSTFT